MRTRFVLLLLVLGFGLGVPAAAPAPAADQSEKPDAARIAKLITQLGSDDFDEREKATADLAAIGEPALDALRQAAKSTDEEVHRRAATLAAEIQKRQESVAALVPKRVHLVYKDAPVKDAVADFKKQAGYDITLHDPDNKLKDRTVTLDTGDVTFWQAFDRFCAKADLKEADARDLAPAPVAPLPPLGVPTRVILPGGPLPKADAPATPPKDSAAPAPPPAVAPAAPPAVGAPILVAPGGALIIGGPAVGPVAGLANAVPEGITLVDGKPEALPTDASSAVRVQALAKADGFGPAPDGEYAIALRLSPEPKLQGQSVDKVTVVKATDDQKQQLAQTATGAAPAGGPLVLGGARQDVVIHLKKGDKAAKTLTELSGTVGATVLGEVTPVITATEILKASGKVFKGGENGQIKVAEVTTNENGQITIHVELQAPTDCAPAGIGPAGPVWRLPIRRVPLPAPAPAAPGAAPAAAGVAIVIGAGFAGMNSANGLSLVDDKGEPIKQVRWTIEDVMHNGGGFSTQYVLTFQTEKGQEAAKLVYSGRKVLNVEIPFSLRDVPLP